jgi:hypothetical protein
MKLVEATLDHIMIERPEPSEEHPQHLCLDAGYDDDQIFEAARDRHSVPHIRPNRYNRAHGKPEPETSEHPVRNPLESTKKPRRSRGGAPAFLAQPVPTAPGTLGEACADL